VSQKRENTFISGVHRHLNDVYKEKTSNPWRRGIADVWYSGNKNDLWIEYKYILKIPKRTDIVPDLSDLQAEWLAGRESEGRNVAVVVGCPEGCVLYRQGNWLKPETPDGFRSKLITKKELADWIRRRTGTSNGNIIHACKGNGAISQDRC
jgi:hypothetical protein